MVPGPHSKVATMKDIQRVWVLEDQEKSIHEWILARFYFRILGPQDTLELWPLTGVDLIT